MSPAKRWDAPPPLTIDPEGTYEAVVETSVGSFTIALFAKESPRAVNNFVFLAGEGFYEGCQFFRVIAPFMIQTGDPTNRGTGGPGYRWKDELPVPHRYEPGIVAMANAGPDTNGSQFFICTGPSSTGLNQSPNYTEFGRVKDGMEVVQAIARGPVAVNPMSGERSRPTDPQAIVGIAVQRLDTPQEG